MAHSVVSEALKVPTYRQPLVFASNINGTKEFPLYSFASDKRSGLYMKSVGSIGIAANSQEVMNITEKHIDFKVPLRFNGKILDIYTVIEERNKTQAALEELKQQLSDIQSGLNTSSSTASSSTASSIDPLTVSITPPESHNTHELHSIPESVTSPELPKTNIEVLSIDTTTSSLSLLSPLSPRQSSLPLIMSPRSQVVFIAAEDIPKSSIVGLDDEGGVRIVSGVKFHDTTTTASNITYYTYSLYEKSCLFAYVKNNQLYIQPSLIRDTTLQYGDPHLVCDYSMKDRQRIFIQPFKTHWLIFANNIYKYKDDEISILGQTPANILSVDYDELTNNIILFYHDINNMIFYQIIKVDGESIKLLVTSSLGQSYSVSFKSCLAYGSVIVMAIDNVLKAAHISDTHLTFGQPYKDADMYSCSSLLYCTYDNYVLMLLCDVANTPYIGIIDIVGNEISVLGKTRLQFHMNDVLGMAYNTSKHQFMVFQYDDSITVQFFTINRDNILYHERYISNIQIPHDYRGSFNSTYIYNSMFMLTYRTSGENQGENQGEEIKLKSCLYNSSYGIHPSCFIGVSNNEAKQGDSVDISLRSTHSKKVFLDLPVGSMVYFNGSTITTVPEGNTKLGLCLSKNSILLTGV